MTIGIVKEITGLSERKIRYYETRQLIFPERSSSGTRKYSFSDVEQLMDIAEKIEDGIQTEEIRKDYKKQKDDKNLRNKMIKGQLNAHFRHTNIK